MIVLQGHLDSEADCVDPIEDPINDTNVHIPIKGNHMKTCQHNRFKRQHPFITYLQFAATYHEHGH